MADARTSGDGTGDELGAILSEGCARLGLELSSAQSRRLLDYLGLLTKWNTVYNLTAIRDPREMVVLHLLDSLAIVPTIDALRVNRVLDVGAGAGLPGIPLAIARPGLQVDLADAVQKKAAFLTQVKIALQLGNVDAHHSRVEALRLAQKPDCAVSRGFSDLADFAAKAGPLLREGGCLVAMKGAVPDREIAELPAGWRVREIIRLSVPYLDAERCLVVLQAR